MLESVRLNEIMLGKIDIGLTNFFFTDNIKVNKYSATLRELIERYYEITGNRTDNLKHVVKSAVDTYNYNQHRTMKTTPNKAWTNNNLQFSHHLKI